MKITVITCGVILPLLVLSCKGPQKDNFEYQSSIASQVYKAQMLYCDQTLTHLGNRSKQGAYFKQESNYIDNKANSFKAILKQGRLIQDAEKAAFYERIERAFGSTPHALIDQDILRELKTLPMESVSDVDLVRLYVKNYFVCILLNHAGMPFNYWGLMSSTETPEIRQGEEFVVSLANTAWTEKNINDWFLVHNSSGGLTKENIIDTLHLNQQGEVVFKTKNYKKGENRLVFISRVNLPQGERSLSKTVWFNVN